MLRDVTSDQIVEALADGVKENNPRGGARGGQGAIGPARGDHEVDRRRSRKATSSRSTSSTARRRWASTARPRARSPGEAFNKRADQVWIGDKPGAGRPQEGDARADEDCMGTSARFLAFLRLSPAHGGHRRPAHRHRRLPAQLPHAAGARADSRIVRGRARAARRAAGRPAARDVAPAELAAIADPDARENYGDLAALSRAAARRRIRSKSAYVGLFQGNGVDVPPLFVAAAHAGAAAPHPGRRCAAAMEARAAEMLFRPQKIAVLEDGAVMAADEATVELFATTGGFGSLGELLAQNTTPAREHRPRRARRGECDAVLGARRAPRLRRSASIAAGPRSTRWRACSSDGSRTSSACDVTIKHERAIDDEHWVWHVGLDAEASGLLNDLYNDVDIDEARMGRLLCLFRLDFAEPGGHAPGDRRPAGLSCDGDGRASSVLKLKPQNLLLNLPLARQQ